MVKTKGQKDGKTEDSTWVSSSAERDTLRGNANTSRRRSIGNIKEDKDTGALHYLCRGALTFLAVRRRRPLPSSRSAYIEYTLDNL